MSILEIILYCIIGLAVAIYITKGIIQIVQRKKDPEKYKNKEETIVQSVMSISEKSQIRLPRLIPQ